MEDGGDKGSLGNAFRQNLTTRLPQVPLRRGWPEGSGDVDRRAID